MVYGYSLSSVCVVCFGVLSIGCVSSEWVISSIGLSLARTSFCFREGLFLYPIMGGSGKMGFWKDRVQRFISFD